MQTTVSGRCGLETDSSLLVDQVLGLVSSAILEDKVRSKGLLFFFRYFFALVYFVFYRNLFARLKDPSDCERCCCRPHRELP